jgi:hypothetical protein
MSGVRHRTWPHAGERDELAAVEPQAALTRLDYHRAMSDAASLDERLEQIGTQLDWVRDYL